MKKSKLIKKEKEKKSANNHFLIIHNDDVNTFDYVISTLIRVCDHSKEQAEQCVFLIHNKGKYIVKIGKNSEIKLMAYAICEAGINAIVQ